MPWYMRLPVFSRLHPLISRNFPASCYLPPALYLQLGLRQSFTGNPADWPRVSWGVMLSLQKGFIVRRQLAGSRKGGALAPQFQSHEGWSASREALLGSLLEIRPLPYFPLSSQARVSTVADMATVACEHRMNCPQVVVLPLESFLSTR